jgi:hypothetical protein
MPVLPIHPSRLCSQPPVYARTAQQTAAQSRWILVARRGEAGASFGKRAGRLSIVGGRGKGEFQQDFFPPVCILTVPHTPWVYKNIPILPGLHNELIKSWFCIIKHDGSSLHVVYDLHPFNAITIGDVSVLPITEQLVESFRAYVCYASLDLFVAYDQCIVHPESWDPTTVQTPLSMLRHTCLVIGHTNLVQVMQGDIKYIL